MGHFAWDIVNTTNRFLCIFSGLVIPVKTVFPGLHDTPYSTRLYRCSHYDKASGEATTTRKTAPYQRLAEKRRCHGAEPSAAGRHAHGGIAQLRREDLGREHVDGIEADRHEALPEHRQQGRLPAPACAQTQTHVSGHDHKTSWWFTHE